MHANSSATRPALLATALGLALMASPAFGEAQATRLLDTEHHTVRIETVARNLEHPWALAFLPDGRFLVTERNSGRLRLGDRDGSLSDPVEGVPEVFSFEGETGRSQAGLFDVKLDPRFEGNQRVYLSYAKPTDRGAALAVARGVLDTSGDAPRLRDVEDFFVMDEADQDSSSLHFGGRMLFDDSDGSLFLTVGERRNISRAQDEDDQAGSVLRIGPDGNAPADNPFAGRDDANPFIYSIGHRNPQGIARAPDGALWINDHGPKGGDEMNRLEPGQNYGWPFLTAGTDYSGAPIGVGIQREGMRSPTLVFPETIAPSGLMFYQGEQFREWQRDALNGAMGVEGIVRVRVDGERPEVSETIDIGRRIRDLQVAGDGSIWVVTEHEDGEVLRLSVADRGAVADADPDAGDIGEGDDS
jgi:aldose sugar dehydrogenase